MPDEQKMRTQEARAGTQTLSITARQELWLRIWDRLLQPTLEDSECQCHDSGIGETKVGAASRRRDDSTGEAT